MARPIAQLGCVVQTVSCSEAENLYRMLSDGMASDYVMVFVYLKR